MTRRMIVRMNGEANAFNGQRGHIVILTQALGFRCAADANVANQGFQESTDDASY